MKYPVPCTFIHEAAVEALEMLQQQQPLDWDHPLTEAFVFGETELGHRFWADVINEIRDPTEAIEILKEWIEAA